MVSTPQQELTRSYGSLKADKAKYIPPPPLYKDVPAVKVVDSNIERAIRELKKRVTMSGVMRLLRDRKMFPAVVDRQREKRRSAAKRQERALKAMATKQRGRLKRRAKDNASISSI